ncbi:MAG: penicillin-binding protein activator [Enterobacteriaceae bacterium]|nr:penicillin-binding protein activator [Enterobacteriaceae bacterium]
MLPSIFVRFKTGLVCTALLATMVIAGCTTPKPQGQPPSAPQNKISAEISHYQAIIDNAAGNPPSLDVIRAYIALEPRAANEAERQKNIDDTWQALTHLTAQQLSELVINADEYTLQGWLDLLNAYQNNKQDPDKLRATIHDWQTRYPDNPAAHHLTDFLPQSSSVPTPVSPEQSVKIGLFLPLSGQAKAFGEAIRQGFLDAQKGLPQSAASANTNANASINTAVQASVTPPAANSQPVQVYDTNSQPLTDLLTQAQQDGVTLVVGPLLKPQVEQLAQVETPLNILALNKLDTSQLHPNICYFPLSPEDEAKSAALHIWQQQKHNPLVLVPRSGLGNRMANAFAAEWQKLGGATVLQQSFGTTAEMRQSMNRGTGIRLSGTPISVSAANTDAVQDQPVADTTISSSRGPVDAVYVIATNGELALIKPMIDMAISSRQKPALYANSRSNKADAGPDFRLEMDGMQFSDIPLLTGTNIPLIKQAANKFGNDYSLMRLYAMGIDAWSLANHFAQLQQGTGFNLRGETGDLSMTDNCTVARQLSWMQFKNGRIEVESSAASNSTDNTSNNNNADGIIDNILDKADQ